MAKKKTKAPKRATRPAPSSKKTAKPTKAESEYVLGGGHLGPDSRPQIAPGAPVFVRVDIGDYQLGVVMRNASLARLGPNQLCVKLAQRNPANMYDVAKFGSEINVDADRVSRVFMERDWESIDVIRSESGAECDERIRRGPSHDELQQQPGRAPVHMVVCDEDDAAELANAILKGGKPTAGTLADLARWTLHTNALLEQWKDKLDKLEDAGELHDANVLATQAKGPPKKGDVIDLWLGKGNTESVKVTMVDANEVHFVGVDGNGGSRPLSDEGDRWLVNTAIDAKIFDARAANWALMNPSKKMTGVPVSQLEDAVDVAPSSPVPSQRRRDLPKAGATIEVDGIGLCIVETCARGYVTFRGCGDNAKGRRRTSDADWRVAVATVGQIAAAAAPAAPVATSDMPAKGTKISVRTGGSWETVTVTGADALSRLVSFAADDGVGGTLRMSQLDVGWRYLSNAEAARLEKTAKTPAALAQGAEAERKGVERDGNKAARKAAGGKMSPIDRAVADAGHVEPRASTPISLRMRNIAAVKRLGISIDEVMRRREAGTLELGPEDRQAGIETTQRTERASAGLDDRGMPFASMPHIGDAVEIMSVSGWVPTEVIALKANAFIVKGGLALAVVDHGKAWRTIVDDSPDAEELAIADDRELRELGKKRAADGTIVDVAPAGDPWEDGQPDHGPNGDNVDAIEEAAMPWD